MGGKVSLVDGHIDEPKCCENCLYYDNDRQDQPCCTCFHWVNWEKTVNIDFVSKKDGAPNA